MSYVGPREMHARQIAGLGTPASWRYLDSGICALLLEAASDKEMAEALGAPVHAVEIRMAAIRKRHKARNRVHLALILANLCNERAA